MVHLVFPSTIQRSNFGFDVGFELPGQTQLSKRHIGATTWDSRLWANSFPSIMMINMTQVWVMWRTIITIKTSKGVLIRKRQDYIYGKDNYMNISDIHRMDLDRCSVLAIVHYLLVCLLHLCSPLRCMSVRYVGAGVHLCNLSVKLLSDLAEEIVH